MSRRSRNKKTAADTGVPVQADTGEPGPACPLETKGQRLGKRALALFGFILSPFMAVGLLGGVVSISEFVPRYRLGCLLTAIAAAAAIYVLIKLLKTLFVSL